MTTPTDRAQMRNPLAPTDDRLRLLMIGRHDMVDIMRGRVRIANLPEDASLIRWSMPYEVDGFAIVVHSATFDPVPERHHIPELWAMVDRITADEYERLARAQARNVFPTPGAVLKSDPSV